MNCSHCNTPNQENSRFCKSCGSELRSVPVNSVSNSNAKNNRHQALFIGTATVLLYLNITTDFVIWYTSSCYTHCPDSFIGVFTIWLQKVVMHILPIILGFYMSNIVVKRFFIILGTIVLIVYLYYARFENPIYHALFF